MMVSKEISAIVIIVAIAIGATIATIDAVTIITTSIVAI